jgi:hypothetical protein
MSLCCGAMAVSTLAPGLHCTLLVLVEGDGMGWTDADTDVDVPGDVMDISGSTLHHATT